LAARLIHAQLIRASVSPGEVRVALVQNDQLVEYALWRPGSPDGFGDVHIGRVISRVSAMAGCFVALADGAEGFLPDSVGGRGASAGQIVTVHVTRAAQGGKGPRLAITNGQAASDGKPRLLARGTDPLRDMAARHPQAPIEVDDPTLLAELQGAFGARVLGVSQAFSPDIEDAVAVLAEPSVALPGGASLHIQPTRALVAIDIDAGGMTGARQSKSAAQAALNQSIFPLLARQILLRNLGGAIVVDLAGMPARRRTALAPMLSAALAADPLHPRLLGFTALGLAEISRPRQRPPLHELLAGPLAVGLSALRAAAAQPANDRLRLLVAPAVAAALEEDATALNTLFRRQTYALTLRSDPSLPENKWSLEVMREAPPPLIPDGAG
jgi:hypothetical protein